jgi:hypothetical protein
MLQLRSERKQLLWRFGAAGVELPLTILPTLEHRENTIEDLVQTPAKVAGQKSPAKISVLLKKRVVVAGTPD